MNFLGAAGGGVGSGRGAGADVGRGFRTLRGFPFAFPFTAGLGAATMVAEDAGETVMVDGEGLGRDALGPGDCFGFGERLGPGDGLVAFGEEFLVDAFFRGTLGWGERRCMSRTFWGSTLSFTILRGRSSELWEGSWARGRLGTLGGFMVPVAIPVCEGVGGCSRGVDGSCELENDSRN